MRQATQSAAIITARTKKKIAIRCSCCVLLIVLFSYKMVTAPISLVLRFLQTEFNMDQMMPKGREHEAPDVLRQDIDIQAAESLHGVVAHLASASEEVGGGGRRRVNL